MNASQDWRVRCHAGLKIVLRLVIASVRQIVEAEIQFDATVYPFRDAEIEDRMPRGRYRGIVPVEAIMIDRAHPERAAEPMPTGQRDSGVRNKMRRAVHVHPVIATPEERIRDLRQPGSYRKAVRQFDRRLGFVAVGAARALELETTVIGDIDLLVRMVDQERVRAQGYPPKR